jgi:hypothetical protein
MLRFLFDIQCSVEIWLKETLGVMMSKVHEYELLSAQYPAELSEAVNAKLAEGWSLCGSPFAGAGEVFQAVVRTIPDDKRLRRASTDTSSD